MNEEKITIDLNKCVGCGKCTEICPKCFSLNQETGKAEVLNHDDLDCALKASDGCPVGAIIVAE